VPDPVQVASLVHAAVMAVERVGVGRKEASPIAQMALDQNEKLGYWLGYGVFVPRDRE
jgi:hypothetical protein